jgi:hypothetical protein
MKNINSVSVLPHTIESNEKHLMQRDAFYKKVEDDISASRKNKEKWTRERIKALERFSKVVMKAAKKDGIAENMKFDGEKFAIEFHGSVGIIGVDLRKLHKDYHSAPMKKRADVMRGFTDFVKVKLTGMFPMPTCADEAKNKMMMLVRSASIMYEGFGSDEADGSLYALELSDDAVIVIGLDLGLGFYYVTLKMLNEWGISVDDAMSESYKNLRQAAKFSVEKISPGLFRVVCDGDLGASCILLLDKFESLGLDGDSIFMIPTKGCVLAATKNSASDQWAIIEAAKREIQHEQDCVSTKLYKIESGALVPFKSEHEEVRGNIVEVRKNTLSGLYYRQQNFLRERFKKKGLDLFVATFGFIGWKNTKTKYSYCSLAEDIQQLLPETDLVAMVMPKNSERSFEPLPKFVRWEDVIAVLGDRMEKIECYPARYYVSGYPTIQEYDNFLTVFQNSDFSNIQVDINISTDY